jgi:hypothetical protein
VEFYLQLALLLLGAVFVMTWLPILDTVPDETWSREDLWRLLETTGLWLAAAVGIAAIYVSSHDAREQLTILIDQAKNTSEQVKEAKSQRLLLVEQTRAHLRREPPQVDVISAQQSDGSKKIIAWQVSPVWTNTGSTSAKEVRTWYRMATGDLGLDPPNVPPSACPDVPLPPPSPSHPPTVVAPGGSLALVAVNLVVQDLLAAQQRKKTILLFGHVEYRDVYPETSLHREDW